MAKLGGLIRLKKHELDQQREMLVRLQDKLATQLQAKADLLAQLETEKNLAAVDIHAARGFGQYLQRALQQIEEMERAIDATGHEIYAARRVVQDAFMEVKKLDITEERRAEEEKNILAHKVATELDEIGLNVFQRGQENVD